MVRLLYHTGQLKNAVYLSFSALIVLLSGAALGEVIFLFWSIPLATALVWPLFLVRVEWIDMGRPKITKESFK